MDGDDDASKRNLNRWEKGASESESGQLHAHNLGAFSCSVITDQ